MIHGVSGKVRVFIALGATDMRKSINGLSLLVEEQFELDLFSGSYLGVSCLAYRPFATGSEISSRFYIGLTVASASG